MNKTIPFFFCLFLSSMAQGQYIFQSLKPKDGLSSREAKSLYKDREGFLWIGTANGLNRFDGNNFKIWDHRSTGYPGSLGEDIYSIIEHGKNKIWFGTNAGVGVLDKNSQTITEVKIRNAKGKNTERIRVTKLLHDKDGRLWMATANGIYLEQQDEFLPVSAFYSFAKKLDSGFCYQAAFLYDSTKNVFWIGTPEGMYQLNLKADVLYSYAFNPEGLPVLNNHAIYAIEKDKKGNIWYSDATDGSLNYFDFASKKLQTSRQISKGPAGQLKEGCNYLFMDREERLWISTWLYNSFIRYPDGKIERIPYNKDRTYSISYGFISDALEDEEGSIWLATINGISKRSADNYIEDILVTPSGASDYDVGFTNLNDILPDQEGKIWLAKLDGLFAYDKTTHVFEKFPLPPDTKHISTIERLYLINGEIWCTNARGIWIFNRKEKKFRYFNNYPGVEEASYKVISWVTQTPDGFIWFSVWGQSVFRYSPVTGECIRINSLKDFPADIHTVNSRCAYNGTKNKFWICIQDKGLIIYDRVKNIFTKPESELLIKQQIIGITEDSSHYMWVSVLNRGIYKCTQEGKIVDSITEKNGLVENRFTRMCIDPNGRLWCTLVREELVCIDPSTRKITAIKPEVDFSFNDHWIGLKMQGDRLYVAMLDKLVIINTSRFQSSADNRPPLISGFRVFQQDQPFNKDETVRLSYNQNYFSVSFSSALHHEDPSIQYAYMLKGFDKDWIYCGRDQTAAYTNVPDGHYTFLVKATGNKGQWMTTASSLKIHVLSPFWKTGWFIGAVLVLLGFTAWRVYHLGFRRRQRKNIEKTIDYFANSVYGENSVNEICWDIARNCISQLQFEDCVVYLLDPEKNVLIQKAAYGPKNPKGHEIENPLEIAPGKGIVGTVAATGKPLLVGDTTKDSRYIVDDERRLSELAVPVLHDGKVIGVIDSEHPAKHFFTEAHLKALSTIASISANKIAEAQAEEHARENEIKLLEINKMLAESQLMALRAQMNPHFVFNCLNSIQECIVTQKYGEASDYLNKFSKLFRTVLNNSGKNLVTIDEEKEVLKLYLELELMRFDKSFQYEIAVDENLETDEILMPSMLLQPYVENALWHGLMHKEGERRLEVRFTKISEDVFSCVIDDNGIGRKRSFELKEQQSKTKRHESRGLKITRDRIDILQQQGFHARLEIQDKISENGEAEGTRVIVELSTFLTTV